MTHTRLPRPGEVEEHCRLCAAVLELSLENPRRVCAACGEVNLPSDHAVAAAPSVLNAARAAPTRLPVRPELLQLLIGAVTPWVGAFTGIFLNWAALLLRLQPRELGSLPFLVAGIGSLIAAWRLHRRAGGNGLLAAGLWLGGAGAGLAVMFAVAKLAVLVLAKLIWH